MILDFHNKGFGTLTELRREWNKTESYVAQKFIEISNIKASQKVLRHLARRV